MLRIEAAAPGEYRYWIRRRPGGGWPLWLRGLSALANLAVRVLRRLGRALAARLHAGAVPRRPA